LGVISLRNWFYSPFADEYALTLKVEVAVSLKHQYAIARQHGASAQKTTTYYLFIYVFVIYLTTLSP
jgi:hypothetical protein